jgi:hypothetical protein
MVCIGGKMGLISDEDLSKIRTRAQEQGDSLSKIIEITLATGLSLGKVLDLSVSNGSVILEKKIPIIQRFSKEATNLILNFADSTGKGQLFPYVTGVHIDTLWMEFQVKIGLESKYVWSDLVDTSLERLNHAIQGGDK